MTRLPAGISGKRAPAAATTVKGAQFGENRVLQPTFFKRGVQATSLSFSILQRAQSPEPTGVAGRCEQGWVQMQPTLLSPACNCMPRKPGRNAAPNCAPPRYTRKDTQRPEKPHTGRSVGLWVGTLKIFAQYFFSILLYRKLPFGSREHFLNSSANAPGFWRSFPISGFYSCAGPGRPGPSGRCRW